jgi:acetoacetyl-CoA reductase/3-oxoacyl-[acyl-carrier protein] reductase
LTGVSLSLAGRGALVTGAGGGIGGAVAAALRDAGARVVASDLPGREPPAGTEPLPCDLADAEAVRAAVAEAGERFDGRLHLLVHAAGIARDALLWKMRHEEWREVMRVNLDAAFLLLREAVPLLRAAGGGAVVLVSSINGERGKVGQANYAASKAGLNALARTAARELGRFGVRVNAVAPGLVLTPMTEGLPEEVRRRALEETALGRHGAPGDVAGVVLFLCSDLSRHVTGQVIRVDGGQLIA